MSDSLPIPPDATSGALHPRLGEQLREHGGSEESAPRDWRAFVADVAAGYARADDERHALESRVAQLAHELASVRHRHAEELAAWERVEREMREGSDQLRTLAESMAAAMFIYQGSHFRYVNAAGLALTGYTLDELLRMEFWQLVHPDHRDLVRERGLARQRGEAVPPRYQMKILTKSGEERWLDFTAGLTVFEGQLAGLGTAFDITEQKRATAALELQALVFENLHDAVVVADLDERVLGWNPAAERMYGYGRDEMVGRSVLSLVHPDEREALHGQVMNVVGRNGRWSGTIRFVRKDGSEGVSESIIVSLFDTDGRCRGTLGVNKDVTSHERATQALQETEQRYRALFEQSRDAIYMTTLEGRLIDVNQAFLELFGYAREEIIGRDLRDVYAHTLDRTRLQDEIARSGFVREYEIRLVRKDGQPVDCLLSASYRRDAGGNPIGLQGIIHDISERKRAERQLEYNALHDVLTGLPNRALFLDRLRHVCERARRGGEGLFAVLFLDLDRFKVVNDSLGHAAGDDLLRALAGRLASVLRGGDTVARFGGDEFTLLLEDLDGADEATRVAERLLAAIAEPFTLERHEVFTSASVGIALSSTGFAEPDELLRNADAALSRAKAAGKARFEVFDRAMHASALARLQTELDLRRAIERGEFMLQYQPIVDLRTGRIAAFEALARWHHPSRGVLAPAEFIDILEETGLIIAFGRWVLDEACAQLARWRAHRPDAPLLRIAINVSPRQLRQPDFPAELDRLRRAHGVPDGALALEVTESVLIENSTAASALLARVRELGVELHLDDFGTGYSSLGSLHRVPLDALKIDRSFVARLDRDARSARLVEAVVRLAHSLGVATVAEGVRTASQLATLREFGCEFAQGFHFAPAVSSAEAERILGESPRW